MSVAVCPAQHLGGMAAPATTVKGGHLGGSAGAPDRGRAAPTARPDKPEGSCSAASSSGHLPAISSSSPGASNSAPLPWHDDGETTDDQDEAGWQLVQTKGSARVAGTQHVPCSSSCGGGGGGGGATSGAASSSKPAVCGRCGMRGHLAARCRQPHCSRCNKWWHTEEECSRACHACGSLEHRISAATPLCKSYKCRECGLYGHVYAECPNIVCNLCRQVGHKALDCPSIICNLCKQQGHKAVNCPNTRGVPLAQQEQQQPPPTGSSSKAGELQQQQLQLSAHVLPQLRQSSSSCGSNASPMAYAAVAAAGSAAAAAAAPQPAGAASGAAGAEEHHEPPQQQLQLQEVPLALHSHPPASTAEVQLQQQEHSRLLSQLIKTAPDVAVAYLDDSSKLRALLAIEPHHLTQLVHSLAQQPPAAQHAALGAAVASVQRQLQQQQHAPHAWQQPLQVTAGGSQLERPLQLQHISVASCSSASASPAATPRAMAAAAAAAGLDGGDATQGIKPGDLVPQHARQLVAEFGDMLPSRWQQLPSWRQLEARLSFPDGNYVQRRLQFRERRRQLQLLTLQLRAAAAVAKQQQAAGRSAGSAARPVAAKAMRVVTQLFPASAAASAAAAAPGTPVAAAASAQPAPSGARQAGTAAPCSYAAALAGASQGSAAAGPAAAPSPGPSSADDTSSAATVLSHPHQPSEGAGGAAAAGGLAVCWRCGMMGHIAASCAQPRCSRCHLWWHSEAQCASACQFCGSLDHQGDAEQPASCQSFRCKACKMFGHTATACPHVQLHQQQEQAKRQQPAAGASATPSPAPPGGAVSSSQSGTSSMSYQLALQSPASLLTKQGTMSSMQSSSSGQLDSPLRPPDSPGLGQQGVKPRDLLPEHARALQEEFPNALPPGWQQMASWRMVEERLRVVAVEGAVFSKRRQMWRDRRKHYQALTAQALAAAARSAACDAAAASAASRAAAAATAGGAAAASDASSQTAVAGDGSSAAADGEASSRPPLDEQQQQQQNGAAPPEAAAGAVPFANHVDASAQHAASGAAAAAYSPTAHLPPLQQQPQQPQHLAPEWQKQGSLFGLMGSASAGLAQLDGLGGGQAGSTFSCDTASFCCSPMPAVTPTVLMSPLDDHALAGYSGGSTPLHPGSGCSTSCVNTPGMMLGGHGGGGGSITAGGRHPSGGMLQQQQHGPLSLGAPASSPMANMQHCSTPMPTPRSAAASAAAAAGGSTSSGMHVPPGYNNQAGAMGMMQGDGQAGYGGMQFHPSAGLMPRSPLSYGMQHPSSPLGNNAAAAAAVAASRGMPAGMMGGGAGGAAAMYHQHNMMVAQRQSQLQQQLMLQGSYVGGPRGPAASEAPASHHHHQQQQQQALLNLQQQQAQAMQAQQQQQQQQQHARMQQRRMDQAFLVQQAQAAQQRQQQALQAEEFGDNGGELDDKLGVLGVLGLQ